MEAGAVCWAFAVELREVEVNTDTEITAVRIEMHKRVLIILVSFVD
jgi:hypothetical protein